MKKSQFMKTKNNNQTLKGTSRFPQISNTEESAGNPSSQNFVELGQAAGMQIGVCSEQGKRPYQEDEYAIRPFVARSENVGNPRYDTHFFGLYDGHAGGRCSKYVSANLPDTFAEDSLCNTNPPQAIKRAYHTVNEQFLKIAEKMKLHDGSTGITAILRDGKLFVANVGDCRALILSGGKPIQMSVDQKPTSLDEQKRIAQLGGTVVNCMGVARVNGVLAVSRAFGNRTLRQVIRPDAELTCRDLVREDDYLVMASDGLWDVLRNKDVSDICYSAASFGPQHLAEELVNTALARGSMDNVTCIVVRIDGYYTKLQEKMRENGNSKSDMQELLAKAPVRSASEYADMSGSAKSNNISKVGAAGALIRHRSEDFADESSATDSFDDNAWHNNSIIFSSHSENVSGKLTLRGPDNGFGSGDVEEFASFTPPSLSTKAPSGNNGNNFQSVRYDSGRPLLGGNKIFVHIPSNGGAGISSVGVNGPNGMLSSNAPISSPIQTMHKRPASVGSFRAMNSRTGAMPILQIHNNGNGGGNMSNGSGNGGMSGLSSSLGSNGGLVRQSPILFDPMSVSTNQGLLNRPISSLMGTIDRNVGGIGNIFNTGSAANSSNSSNNNGNNSNSITYNSSTGFATIKKNSNTNNFRGSMQ